MTDMLEKMARAIYDYAFRADCWVDAPECLDLTSVEIEGNMNLIEAVRSALQAIREPDGAMVSAGSDLGLSVCDDAGAPGCVLIFTAMIDAILQGGE